jgi:hypothetical protein
LVNVERRNSAADSFEPTRFYDPMQLAWASRPNRAFEAIDIPRGVAHFLDILSTRDLQGDQGFKLETEFTPLRELGLGTDPGEYRLTIMVGGDNFSPRTLHLVVRWNGRWDAIEVTAV